MMEKFRQFMYGRYGNDLLNFALMISTLTHCRLVLGASDSMTTHIKVAELMYFEGKPGMGLLRRVQSYLAIKYGVTLGPVNYTDGYGNILWRYNDNKKYHNRIMGVGVDST